MRAAVFGDPAALGQEPGLGDPVHGVGRLHDERGRLSSSGLIRNRGVSHELSQAA